MKKRPTSSEVAKLAGVSRTTVSFVLNNVEGANISDGTRQKVLEVAESLGYVPDAAARRLASGKSYTLGLLICQSEHLQVDAFIPQVLYGMNVIAFEHGFRVLVEAVEDTSDPKLYRELIRAKQIDGLAVLNPRLQDFELLEQISSDFPVIDVGTAKRPRSPVPSRGSESAQQVVKHFLKLGHERIAHISFAPEDYPVSVRRERGYLLALQEAGIQESWLVKAAFSAQSGYQAMQKLLSLKTLPTALFAGNDTIAFGAMRAIFEAGLRIPEDIAVIGYDDIPLAAFSSPSLSTVKVDAIALGKRAADVLLSHISDNQNQSSWDIQPPQLILRESCGSNSF
ncbi:MAG: LacI family DNA-binding transcriptional regulator [Deinococcales bacterium]